jgi:hypothetical protein
MASLYYISGNGNQPMVSTRNNIKHGVMTAMAEEEMYYQYEKKKKMSAVSSVNESWLASARRVCVGEK